MGFEPTDPCGSNDFESCSHLVLSCLLWSVAAVLETAKILVLQRISDAPTGIDQLHIKKTRVQIEMRNAPKRSIFCTLARKYARRKPLSGMVLQTAPRIKCKKNRLKTDYTKRPFGPKHRKESSL